MTFKHRSDRVRDNDSPWWCVSTFPPWTQRQQREGCGSGRARDDEPVANAGTGDMGSGNWWVITKAGRTGRSNQPLGHVTTPAAQCQGMMGHADSTARITWSEGRVSWRNQKKCNEVTCWMKTEQTQTSFVIKFARTSNLGAGGRERKVWKLNITVVLVAALLLVVKTGRSWNVQ